MSSSAVTTPPSPPAPAPLAAPRRAPVGVPLALLALAAITAAAAFLRLSHLGSVPGDPFYDAAVRSMGLSWHNFFFGAFEPDGSVSIDKPPLDLWLQVVSVKLFGFTSFALKFPEALAGTLSAPVLYAALRRPFGRGAALAAALALAVLPIEVITARSDTMDGLMMLLIVLALWACVRATEKGSTRWLLLAAVGLGLAFNVKLLESIVPLPGLALFAYLGLPGSRRRRLLQLLAAAAVYVAVSLSWLTGTLLFPAHDRPFAIGSTNGSAWNAAFVFNGSDRVSGSSTTGGPIAYGSSSGFPTATQSERDHIPITAPSPTRLLTRVGPLSGERLGLELLAALLLGTPALIAALLAPSAVRRRRRAGVAPEPGPPVGDPPAAGANGATASAANGASAAPEPTADPPERDRIESASPTSEPNRSASAPAAAPAIVTAETPSDSGPDDETWPRVRRAAAAGLLLWLAMGVVLFSEQARLHPRYVEAFTPAVAAVLGIGVAWVAEGRRPWRLAWLAVSLGILIVYAERLVYGTTGAWSAMALAGALAVLAAALALVGVARGHRTANATIVGTLILAAVLSIPLATSLRAVRANVSDAGHVGSLPAAELRQLSGYLRAHQGTAHYEVAAASATAVGALIVKDVRPVLILTTYDARTLTSVAQLRTLIASGKVRYAFLNTDCGRHTPPTDAACSAPVRWIRAHGINVSGQAGLGNRAVLWRLPESIA